MNKGIVLKINPTSVIVLTPDGEYLKCKRLVSSYAIGEEIQFPNYAVIVNKKMNGFIPKLVPVMIASVLIFMSFVLVDWNKKRVLAAGYVNIESKAKVSLILDKQLKVIALKAQNDQGKKVIADLKNWEKESVKEVADKLIVELEKNRIIQHDDKVTISGSMEKKFSNEQKKLRKEINNIKQSNSHFENENSIKELEKHKDAKNKKDKQNGLNTPSKKAQTSGTIKNETKKDSKMVTKQVNNKGHNNKQKPSGTKPVNQDSRNNHHGNKKPQEKIQDCKDKDKKDNCKNDNSKKKKKNNEKGYHLNKGDNHSKDRKQGYQGHRKEVSNKLHKNRSNRDQDSGRRS